MSCLNDTVGYFHDSCGGPIVGPFQFKFRGGQECEKRCGTLDRGFSQRKWETVNLTFTPHSVPQDFWESPIYLANIPPKKNKNRNARRTIIATTTNPPQDSDNKQHQTTQFVETFRTPPPKKNKPLGTKLVFSNFPFPDAPPAATGIFTYIYPQKKGQKVVTEVAEVA